MERHSLLRSPDALGSASGHETESDSLLSSSSRPRASSTSSTCASSKSIRTSCIVILVLVSVSNSLMAAPLERLYESVICKKYYMSHDPSKIGRDGTVQEEKCKCASIQGDLGIFLTRQMLINIIPSESNHRHCYSFTDVSARFSC
jgi:hypothetical protein